MNTKTRGCLLHPKFDGGRWPPPLLSKASTAIFQTPQTLLAEANALELLARLLPIVHHRAPFQVQTRAERSSSFPFGGSFVFGRLALHKRDPCMSAASDALKLHIESANLQQAYKQKHRCPATKVRYSAGSSQALRSSVQTISRVRGVACTSFLFLLN